MSFIKIGAVTLLLGINECTTSTFQFSWTILIKFNTEDSQVWSVLSFERIDAVQAIREVVHKTMTVFSIFRSIRIKLIAEDVHKN
jgi:hypothetical protein